MVPPIRTTGVSTAPLVFSGVKLKPRRADRVSAWPGSNCQFLAASAAARGRQLGSDGHAALPSCRASSTRVPSGIDRAESPSNDPVIPGAVGSSAADDV